MSMAVQGTAKVNKTADEQQRFSWAKAWEITKTAWFKFISAVDYVFSGRVIMGIVQWILRFNGYAAEGSMMLSVLWISACSVAPTLVELLMPEKVMNHSVDFCLTVLSLIPEIMLINAIVNVIEHWNDVKWECSVLNFINWAWSLLFTVPTVIFFILTTITLLSISSTHGNVVAASANLLGWRCLSGWIYGLLDGVYAGVKKMIAQRFEKEQGDKDLQSANTEMTLLIGRLQEQIAELQAAKPAKASTPARKRPAPQVTVQKAEQEIVQAVEIPETPAAEIEESTVEEKELDQADQGDQDQEEVHTDTNLTVVGKVTPISKIQGPAIRKLWDENPGKNYKEIAKLAQCSERTAIRWMPEELKKKQAEKEAVEG